ncbi:unnamed protein product [Arabidopsis lyrata]|nr:unnamed protein product [Arabidopsis lyrata]
MDRPRKRDQHQRLDVAVRIAKRWWKYMPMMELGVSSNMFDIKKNALKKLSKQQSAYRIKLLSSYKEMVAVVVEMVNASRSLRCYTKLGTESLVQFSCSKEDSSDAGDCGGIPKMAEEFVEMFIREVMIKGLLIMELISLSTEVPSTHQQQLVR